MGEKAVERKPLALDFILNHYISQWSISDVESEICAL